MNRRNFLSRAMAFLAGLVAGHGATHAAADNAIPYTGPINLDKLGEWHGPANTNWRNYDFKYTNLTRDECIAAIKKALGHIQFNQPARSTSSLREVRGRGEAGHATTPVVPL